MKVSTILKALLAVLPFAAVYAATETTNQQGGITRMLQQEDITAGLATGCPTGLEAQVSYFDSKHVYAMLAPLDTLSEDVQKSNLVAVAQFLGEIRSRRIPDYQKQRSPANSLSLQAVQISGTNVLNPRASTDPEVKNAYQKALSDWQLREKTFELQQRLELDDVNLTPRLLEACSRLPKNNPANVELLKQVSDAAHLTAAERRKL